LEEVIRALAPTRPTFLVPFGRPVPVLDLPGQMPPPSAFPRILAYGEGVPGSNRQEIRYLMAAYDADIRGSRDHHSDRERRRDVQHGRRLLAKAQAWPWALFEEGRPCRRWWGDDRVLTAWRQWAQ
jgi:hypothetical protein